MRYILPFLFILSIRAVAIDISRTVTYDSANKTVAPSNLVFIAPLTATSPTTGNSIINRDALNAAISTNRTRSVPIVADMRNLTGLTDGDVIITAGRLASSDGLGLRWVYRASSTAATNTGTVFSSTAALPGRFVAQYSGPARFEWYGAVGDYSTDNTAAIQGAMDYHADIANSVTTQLRFGKGYFKISAALTNNANLDIAGISQVASGSWPNTRIYQTTADMPGFVFGAASVAGRLADLTFIQRTSPGSASFNSYGIFFESGSSLCKVERTALQGFNYGIGCSGQSWNHLFTGLYIGSAERAWVKWGGGTTLSFVNPYFQNIDTSETNSVAVSNMVLSGTTNLTLTLGGPLPVNINTNTLVTLSGFSPSAYNTRYFVQTISGATVTLSTAGALGTITGSSGTLSFQDGEMAEAPIQFGVNSIASFVGADFEHVVIPSGPLISSGGSILTFDNLHLESITSQGSWQVGKQTADGMLDLGDVQLISSSVPSGSVLTILNPADPKAIVNAGAFRLQDMGAGGATMSLSLITSGQTPVVTSVTPGRISRAFAKYTLDSTANAVVLSQNTGATTIPDIYVTGNASVGGNSTVTGTSSLNGPVTITPGPLTITPNTGEYGLTVNGQSASFSGVLNSYSDTAGNSPGYLFQRHRGTVASPTAVQTGDKLFNSTSAGYRGSGNYNYNSSYTQVIAAENFDASHGGAIWQLYVTPLASVTPAQQLRADGALITAYVPLALPGNAASALNAVPKQQLDAAIAAAGTITNLTIISANGVSGSVANPTTAPAITLALGAITPSLVTSGGIVSVPSGSAYRYNGVNVIRAITASDDYFFGSGGNLTMTGTGNTAVGSSAAVSYTSGANNTAVGNFAHYAATTGANNVVVGKSALANDTLGSGNTAIGATALVDQIHSAVDGLGNNTAIGYNAGRGIVTGTNNTILGANVTGLAAGLSGNIILATGAGTVRAQHDGTGWLFNGTIASTGAATIGSNGTGVSRLRHGRATLVAGSVTVADAYVTTSTRIPLSVYTSGGTRGHLDTGTRSAGTSFTITSSSGSDTSVVDWVAFEP